MLRVVRWRSRSVLVLPVVLTGMSMALTGCHAALSSQGTPHSNFQKSSASPTPSKPQPTHGGGTGGGGGKPGPGTSPSPSPSPTDPAQVSLTLLDPAGVQDQDAGKTPSYDNRRLQLTFQDEVTLTGNLVDDIKHTYVAKISDSKVKSKIECEVTYTLSTESNTYTIPKGRHLLFQRDDDGSPNALDTATNDRTAFLVRANDKTKGITSINCSGHLADVNDMVTPSAEDLIDAFGGASLVEVTVVPAPAPNPTPTPTPTATKPPQPPRPTTGGPHHAALTVDRHIASASTSSSDNTTSTSDQPSGQSVEKKSVLIEHDTSYIDARPNFGFQIEGSLNAFGGSTISPAQQGVTSKAVLLETEYQPAFLQSFGVLGFGPSIGAYPTTGSVQVVNGLTSLWEVGAQVRYQFKYFTEQVIVPFVAYNYQRLNYNIIQGGNGSLSIAGGSAGLSVLLNRLDESAAADLYHNTGISRLYLVAEMKNLQGSNEDVAVNGSSFFLGIRCEL
jgi:hypothetical protein